jgi:hypothetical protein
MIIRTASWFVTLPADHVQVGVSRGVPRGMPTDYKRYRAAGAGTGRACGLSWGRGNSALSHLIDEVSAGTNDKKVQKCDARHRARPQIARSFFSLGT